MTVIKEVRIFAIFYVPMPAAQFEPLIMIMHQVFYHCGTANGCGNIS
jgi:hypothetical protein